MHVSYKGKVSIYVLSSPCTEDNDDHCEPYWLSENRKWLVNIPKILACSILVVCKKYIDTWTCWFALS